MKRKSAHEEIKLENRQRINRTNTEETDSEEKTISKIMEMKIRLICIMSIFGFIIWKNAIFEPPHLSLNHIVQLMYTFATKLTSSTDFCFDVISCF